MKYFNKQTDEHKLSYFSLKTILNTILTMENIGQIYHKHKIHKILKCDTTKAQDFLEEDFKEKTSKLV